ncbi:MAG: hypothetical protein GYA21_08110 [Myxococcales bacterium]|nr:hypothetical protein [Myxococcales bacterium]
MRVPDPVVFATAVQPHLVGSCALADCHARDTTFRLRPASSPFPPQSAISHPRELPEPFLGDYFLVLSFCDLSIPERSALVRWGSGREEAHPGLSALTPAEETEVLAWLRSGGASP